MILLGSVELSILISILTGVSGVILGWKGNSRLVKKDITMEANNDAVIKANIDNIMAGIARIDSNQERYLAKVEDISNRIIRLEMESKQTDRRLNKLEAT